ncbi:MAG TPA: alpha/beta hydrolase [Xanthobacteraceae bacterium]|nr:alpha/beta hydrolase [Xanthobacteraceae bacterium]
MMAISLSTRAALRLALLAQLLAVGHASAAEYQVSLSSDLIYAEHDGTKLLGDLYLPKGRIKAPALVAFHGGGWRAGNRGFYRHWGPVLARNGYGLFTVEYRLGKPGVYPAAVYDAKAAVQFIRANSGKFDIDPDRVGLIGDSAGACLAALLALAGDRFTSAYREDANATTPISVKAVIGFYGIYDMLAQWKHDMLTQSRREDLAQSNHDLIVRPPDSITEEFLGVSPTQNRARYLESSPISYVAMDRSADRKEVRFLLINGGRDELVDPETQSGAFFAALKEAGFFAQRITISEAGHFWVSDPFVSHPRSYNATVATRLLRFLDSSL